VYTDLKFDAQASDESEAKQATVLAEVREPGREDIVAAVEADVLGGFEAV
jgi:hypothetical protein